MGTTIDGVPWKEAQPFGVDGPTYREWNDRALVPASQAAGYCLCYHPFSNMINFAGFSCEFCGQPVTEQSCGPDAKELRTAATKTAFPGLFKEA